MFSEITEFIKDWGYLAVFLGSMIEGETIVLTASAFAACGYMSIYKVFLIAFATTVITDQGLFWIGYEMGTEWIVKRFPKVAKVRDKVFNLLHKMDVAFIFAFRFIYGIRLASPLIIGSAKINPLRFAIYNTLSGFCWAVVSCFLGYTIADVVMDGKFDTIPAVIAISGLIIIISCLIGLVFKIKAKKLNKKNKEL